MKNYRERKYFLLPPVTAFLIAAIAVCAVVFAMNACPDTPGPNRNRDTKPVLNASALRPVLSSPHSSPRLLSEDELTECISGKSCTIANVDLNSSNMDSIAQNQAIVELKLRDVTFKTGAIKHLKNAHLKAFYCAGSNVDGALILCLTSLPKLKFANFYRCHFSRDALIPLGRANLERLQLRDCVTESSRGEFSIVDLSSIGRMNSLKHLELQRSKLQRGALYCLRKSRVIVLDASRCSITDADTRALVAMPRLAYVNVTDNPELTSAGVMNLLASKSVKQIKCDVDMSKCAMSIVNRRRVNPALYNVPSSFYRKVL